MRRGLHVFPYLSLCKMKCPLVVPILGRFYFYAQTLQTMSQGCCISKIRVFEMPFMKRIFFKIHHLLPLIGPQ